MKSIDNLATRSHTILRRMYIWPPANMNRNPVASKPEDPAASDDIDALKDWLGESVSQAEEIVNALDGLFAAQFVKEWRPLGVIAMLSGPAAAYGVFKSGWTLTALAGMYAGGGRFYRSSCSWDFTSWLVSTLFRCTKCSEICRRRPVP